MQQNANAQRHRVGVFSITSAHVYNWHSHHGHVGQFGKDDDINVDSELAYSMELWHVLLCPRSPNLRRCHEDVYHDTMFRGRDPHLQRTNTTVVHSDTTIAKHLNRR